MGYVRGTRWTDELIKEKVFEVKESLHLDRMPSRSECINHFHDESLVNAIQKRYRWYELAEKLGLPIKESETYFGKMYEAKAAELLRSLGFEVRRMSQNFPYDLLVDDCLKIDVKASRLYKGKVGDFYSFNLEKPFATCDFYILFTIDDDDSITRTMVVPSNAVIANNQISIGASRSKYHKFTDRFDLLSSASEFWSGLAVIQ